MGALVASSLSCASSVDSSRKTEILEPDYAVYQEFVDPYLQRRCGTLDCHGQPGRAFRLYGVNGLRPFEVGDGGFAVSGSGATLEEEKRANFDSAIALEPEEMSRVMARQGMNPTTLLLLRKPLKLERHKGGPAMIQDDDGYRCVTAWLAVRVVEKDPESPDFITIPPEKRGTLSASARQNCERARGLP
jgi:hypothetical protein